MFQLDKKHQKYSKYKSTNIEWIGDIPDCWDLMPLKRIFKLKKDTVGKECSNYDILSLTLKGVIPRDMESNFGKFPAEFDTYQIVKPNDIIFCLFDYDVTPRTIGFSNYLGLVTGAYTVASKITQINPKYYYYFYLNLDKSKELLHLCTGLRNGLDKSMFFSLKNPIFLYEEQQRIALYLDEKITLLDEAITKKKNQIELLSEHRAAIINDTITKGLNKNVIMKDSGIEWIGMIPKEWEVKKIKYWTSNNANKAVFDKNCFIVALENIESWTGKYILVEEDKIFEGDMNTFRKGDVLFGKLRPYLAKVHKTVCDGLCVGEFLVLRPNKTIQQDFLYYRLISSDFITQVNNSTFGAKMPRADWGFIGNSKIPVPSLQEQTEIVSYLDKETKYIDDMIAKIEKSIELLEEYKTSLISHAVSGKIKI